MYMKLKKVSAQKNIMVMRSRSRVFTKIGLEAGKLVGLEEGILARAQEISLQVSFVGDATDTTVDA